MIEIVCISILRIVGTITMSCFAVFLIALMILGIYLIVKDFTEDVTDE